MNLWKKIENMFVDNEKYFISILSFIIIIFLGVLGKSFFFYKNVFWYIFILFLALVILFIYFLNKNKNFQEFYREAVEENIILNKEIKENKKDYFHIDKIIKIVSVLIIIVFIIYFVYVDYEKLFL